VEGSNLPMPKTLIKSLLNIALPPVRGSGGVGVLRGGGCPGEGEGAGRA